MYGVLQLMGTSTIFLPAALLGYFTEVPKIILVISFYLIPKYLWKVDFIISLLQLKKFKVGNLRKHARAAGKSQRANLVDQNFCTVPLAGRYQSPASHRGVPGLSRSPLPINPQILPLKVLLLLRINGRGDPKRKEELERRGGIPASPSLRLPRVRTWSTQLAAPEDSSLASQTSKHTTLRWHTALSPFPFQHPGANKCLLWIKTASVGPGIMC